MFAFLRLVDPKKEPRGATEKEGGKKVYFVN